MKSLVSALLLTSSISAAAGALAQTPTLVKDIYPGISPTPAAVAGFDRICGASGGKAYLNGRTFDDLFGLWVTDGTVAGTRQILDVGASSGADVGGTFYFSAMTEDGGSIWRSDGTTVGTSFVGGFSTDPTVFASASKLTASGGRLYFLAKDGIHGRELWTSDGTAVGTRLVKDITPGPIGTFDEFEYAARLVDVGGTLYFSGGGGSGYGLWKSDGTDAGTVQLANLSSVSSPVNVNGTLFFSAFDFTHGMELWKSDGTVAGTVLVRDIVPGDTSSTPSSLAAFDGALYFRLWSDGSIWKSDGSEAGTVLVHSIASGEQLVPSGDHLFASSGSELWASDGTAAGTALVRDMGVSFSLVGAATVPGALLFWIDGGSDGLELWRSDGTPAGTTLVRTLGPGNAVPLGGGSTSIPGAAVFLAGNTTLGLWRSDGTPAGTYPLTVPRFPPYDSYPMWLADVNGTLLFFASDEAHGSELWRSDGTPEGTRLVKDITPGSGFTGSSPFLVAPSTVYFLTWANNATKKLYRTDGTEAGTVIVKEVPAGPGTATWLGLLGELFLWVFDDGVHGVEPWRSDGTPDGTVLLGDLTPGAVSSQISAVGALNGQFYLAASDGTSTTLWRTDGSTAGTVAIGPIPATSQPGAELDGVIYFPVTDPTHGNELWRTDGTAAGTGLFLDINPSGGSSPSIVGRPGNRLIFWADDGLHGFEPWVTDGTVPGTVLLKDLNPGPAPSGINRPTTVGSTLYFFAYDGAHGRELWRTDGTAAGTILVRDIAPGLSGSYLIEHMTPMGNGVFFTASNHVSGREPWRSDGTEAGTAQIADLVAGAGNSPTPWTMGHSRTASVRSGGRVFFSATDGTTGYELWSFPIPLGFHPVTPCRVADTRDPTGPAAGVPLANAQTLILPVAGRCGIPSTAISVAANVTVVNPTVTGTLSVFAGGPIVSGTTEVPVTADKTRALNAIPLLGTSGSLSFHAALPQGGSTHVVLDVSGYFE